MLDSFNETLRNELDCVEMAPCEQTQSLDFSALNTFDSEDPTDQPSRAEAGIVMPKYYDESNESTLHTDCVVNSKKPEYSMHAQNQVDEPSFSSKSIHDSFVERQTNGNGNQSSIFRPRMLTNDMYSQRGSYNAPEGSGAVHQSKRMRTSPVSQFTQQEKQTYKPSRQVSVTDSRTMSARQSFDSFGDKVYMMKFPHADSVVCKGNGGNLPPNTLERHQDKADQKVKEVSGYYTHVSQGKKHGRTNSAICSVTRKGDCQSPGLVTPMRSRSPKTVNYHLILGSRANIFKDFVFLLPDLQVYVMNYRPSTEHWDSGGLSYEEMVAKRRLVCAVQTYGGNMCAWRPTQVQQSNVSSIFRSNAEDLATSEWNNDRYDQHLSLRYYENNSHLSWDVEENPPVAGDSSGTLRLTGNGQSKAPVSTDAEDNSKISRDQMQDSNNENNEDLEDVKSESGDTPKMRYRCKLCGQPKQNHVCTYQQALERSIGTMSYSAVNAFEAKEPGKLAPALSDMNNFFDLEDEDEDCFKVEIGAGTSTKCAVEPLPCFQSANKIYIGRRRKRRKNDSEKKENLRGDERLFHKNIEIKQEQFREVSTRTSCRMGDFSYPTLPLTFHQRKKASEDLFSLCQGISGLTDDCAKILKAARESNNWDLAVAEMTTQLLVVIHCPPGDDMLDGLKQHLMTMGISC